MSVPELSDDARRAALKKAAEARKVRAAVKQQLRDGELTLAQVIKKADEDEIIGKTRVSAVLESMPRIGKKTARRTMERLDISESRRLRGLGDRQRARLLEAFDPRNLQG
ncbi:integration host factor, actinobacterial type [Euzebya tangerina]|uniref:integration host factor, actinobacterial type n=1 Tax=Euzebya tangerina TaxID=591198 RepID=UPI000E30D352|nr:integration host factor, actinobacterial type [Euzebya tangerina]